MNTIADSAVRASDVTTFALAQLGPMFDPERNLFCHRLKRAGKTLVREGVSPRYTAMTLLGLHRAQVSGLRLEFPLQKLVRHVLDDIAWIDNAGDLGLLIWLCALTAPDELTAKLAQWGVEQACRSHAEVRTMELAWFLTGVSHAASAVPSQAARLRPVADRAFALLTRNQGSHGYFGHMLRSASLRGLLRGDIGSFADQVYPIYALSKYGQAYELQTPIQQALRCANAICAAQGPQGEWWWHYQASSGCVVERYPVYAVHQDAMAPMALFAIGDAAGVDFDLPIQRGLQWIGGDNELRFDMRDEQLGIIWRSIFHASRRRKYVDRMLNMLSRDTHRDSAEDLNICFEDRPYHLGWVLYAFAGRRFDSPIQLVTNAAN